jgi:hypothetical protein
MNLLKKSLTYRCFIDVLCFSFGRSRFLIEIDATTNFLGMIRLIKYKIKKLIAPNNACAKDTKEDSKK